MQTLSSSLSILPVSKKGYLTSLKGVHQRGFSLRKSHAEQPSESEGELSEVAEDVCPEQAASSTTQEPEEEEPVQSPKGYKVLPADTAGLG